MPLEKAVSEALDEALRNEAQSSELKTQLKQLVANWFDRNATDDDVARIVRSVHVHTEQES
jgi:hypothetical protein